MTSTTVTAFPEEKAPPSYPQTSNYPQTTYPQTTYPQTGYPQPVQAANPYPPTQGYYPDTAPAQAPAQAYPPQQAEPVKYPDGGYQPPTGPGYQPYATDQAPPTYNAAQDQTQTHGMGYQP